MIKTKKDLRETIQPYMRDEQHTARLLYENFRGRFKLTESFEEFMKTKKIAKKDVKEE